MRVVALLAALLVAAGARAETVTLRIATIAPDGSGWAREFANYSRDVETRSHGAVRIKFYFSGIAGDEFAVLDRIRREQLDGVFGSEVCKRLAPSLKVASLVGLFRSREETDHVITRLKPTLDEEFLRAGFINLVDVGMGPEVLFTRRPVHDLGELKRTPLWIWDLDDTLRAQGAALGLRILPRPIAEAARAYDEGATDGFIAIPTGALAFQWSAQTRFLSDLRFTFRTGCAVIASRALDALPIESQQAVRAATAKLNGRMTDLARHQDDELLGGLLARQGVATVPVSERFRTEFYQAAQDMRAHTKVVPDKLLQMVQGWLSEYRASRAQR